MAWQKKYSRTQPKTMATMAADFESVERAAANKAQAATIPESCTAFPTVMESRPKILRRGGEIVTTIVAASCRASSLEATHSFAKNANEWGTRLFLEPPLH